ncbi:hypothetical protein K437DRAFT_71480 [Tilletiaria anomala UBC 951]|uniref:Uncharacterized protein n=1 Tax=Tilletiaria anomala (strain ATCC 24038 / CBS 436.72 / UBC 951) TaxID=1037660 RepID=A0A066WI02_TILAU|nr:uncharacterized protein K437DRAFT_71480 [Tilletiaria anomala UBC 951]KDN53431.1 hypothetical protein K437DRAFT_71480 [Tilletiaria anomala UBC 951]
MDQRDLAPFGVLAYDPALPTRAAGRPARRYSRMPSTPRGRAQQHRQAPRDVADVNGDTKGNGARNGGGSRSPAHTRPYSTDKGSNKVEYGPDPAGSKRIINAGSFVLAGTTGIQPRIAYTSALTLTDPYGFVYTSPAAVAFSTAAVAAAHPSLSAGSPSAEASFSGSNADSDASSSAYLPSAWQPPPPHFAAYLGMSVFGIIVLILAMSVVGICVYRHGVRNLERKATELQASIDSLDRQARSRYHDGSDDDATKLGGSTSFVSDRSSADGSLNWPNSRRNRKGGSTTGGRLKRWWSGNRSGPKSRKVQSAPSVIIDGHVQRLVSPYETPVAQAQGASLWSRLPGSGSVKTGGLFRYRTKDYGDLPTSVSLPNTPRFADFKVDLYEGSANHATQANAGGPNATGSAEGSYPSERPPGGAQQVSVSLQSAAHPRQISSTSRGATNGQIHQASASPLSAAVYLYSPTAWRNVDSPLISAPSPALDRESMEILASPNRQHGDWHSSAPKHDTQTSWAASSQVPRVNSDIDSAARPFDQDMLAPAGLTCDPKPTRPPFVRRDSSEETLVGSSSFQSVSLPTPVQGLGVSLDTNAASDSRQPAAKLINTLNETIADWQSAAAGQSIPQRLGSCDILAAISPSSSEHSMTAGATTMNFLDTTESVQEDVSDFSEKPVGHSSITPQSRPEPATHEEGINSKPSRIPSMHMIKTHAQAMTVTPTRARIMPAPSRERYRRTIDAIADMDGLDAIEEALRLIAQLLVVPSRPSPRRRRAGTLPTQESRPIVPIKTRPRRGTESSAENAMLHSVRQQLLLNGPPEAKAQLARSITKTKGQVRFLLDVDQTDKRHTLRNSSHGHQDARTSMQHDHLFRPVSTASTGSAYSVASRPNSLAPRIPTRSWVSSTVPYDAASALHEFFGMEINPSPSSMAASNDDHEEVMSMASGSDGMRFEAVTLHPEQQGANGSRKAPSNVRGLGYHLPQRMSHRVAHGTAQYDAAHARHSSPGTPCRTSTSSSTKRRFRAGAKISSGLGLFLDDTTGSDEDMSELPRMLWRPSLASGLATSASGIVHHHPGPSLSKSESNPRGRSLISNEADIDAWSFFATREVLERGPSSSSRNTLQSPSSSSSRRSLQGRTRSPSSDPGLRPRLLGRSSSPPPSPRTVEIDAPSSPLYLHPNESIEALSNSASTNSAPSSPAEYEPAMIIRLPNSHNSISASSEKPQRKLAKRALHRQYSEYMSPTMQVFRFYIDPHRQSVVGE